MPQWRKLHTKTVESLDINDMPDDFTRLTWVLLPLCCCRDGRGMFHAAWLKSNIYPLRDDVTPEMILGAMQFFADFGMIELYRVGRREYFQICQWFHYQGNTDKEAISPYPGLESGKLISKSIVSPELVQSKSGVSQTDVEKHLSASDSASASDSKKAPQKKSAPAPMTIPDCLNTPAFTVAWSDFTEHRKEIKSPMTPRAANMQLKTLAAYTPDVAVAMIEQTIANGWKGVFELKQNGSKPGRKPQHETQHFSGRM